MSAVILIRHAMPEVDPGVSSKLWGLGDSGREDCVLLAHALPKGITSIWSSAERKARETAGVLGLRLGLEVRVDARFGEVDKPDVWDRDYREVAAGYLAGAGEPGWEPRERVVARFTAAVRDVTAGATGDTVIVDHGMALALWVQQTVEIDLVPWWRALTFPDAWRVNPAAGTLERLWPGGRAGD